MRKTNLTYNTLIEDIRSNGAYFLLDAASNQEASSLAGFFGQGNFSNTGTQAATYNRDFSNPFSIFQHSQNSNNITANSSSNNNINNPSTVLSTSSSSSSSKQDQITRLEGGRVTASSFLDFLENSQQQHINADQPFSLPSFSFLRTETMDHTSGLTGNNNNKPSSTEEVNFANTLKQQEKQQQDKLVKQETKENLGFQNYEAKFLSPPQKNISVSENTSPNTKPIVSTSSGPRPSFAEHTPNSATTPKLDSIPKLSFPTVPQLQQQQQQHSSPIQQQQQPSQPQQQQQNPQQFQPNLFHQTHKHQEFEPCGLCTFLVPVFIRFVQQNPHINFEVPVELDSMLRATISYLSQHQQTLQPFYQDLFNGVSNPISQNQQPLPSPLSTAQQPPNFTSTSTTISFKPQQQLQSFSNLAAPPQNSYQQTQQRSTMLENLETPKNYQMQVQYHNDVMKQQQQAQFVNNSQFSSTIQPQQQVLQQQTQIPLVESKKRGRKKKEGEEEPVELMTPMYSTKPIKHEYQNYVNNFKVHLTKNAKKKRMTKQQVETGPINPASSGSSSQISSSTGSGSGDFPQKE